MIRTVRKFLVPAIVALILSLHTATFAAQEPVDWNKGVITVVGLGVANPKATNPTQIRAMSKRAATLDGYRQLAEIIKGVNVDSETTVDNMMLVNDVVKTQVSAVIKGARVVSERINPDGSCEVTMTVPIYGVSDSLAAAVLPRPLTKEPFPSPMSYGYDNYSSNSSNQGNPSEVNININVNGTPNYTQRAQYYPPYYGSDYPRYFPMNPAPPTKPTTPTLPTSPQYPTPPADNSYRPEYNNNYSGEYTGVVIDCTGLGLKPAMSPVIKNNAGVAIYGSKNLDYDLVTSKGMAAYAKTLDVSQISRGGDKPLIVRATALEGNKVNPVVSVEDANLILRENEQCHFLDDLNVVFVR